MLDDQNRKLLRNQAKEIRVEANSAKVVKTIQINEWCNGFNSDRVIVYASLIQDGEVIDDKEHFFVPMKDFTLPVPEITIEEKKTDKGIEFIINTNVLAKNVWLDAGQEGIFSDNYFNLIPGIPKKITFLARSNEQFAFVKSHPGKITVKSMADFVLA